MKASILSATLAIFVAGCSTPSPDTAIGANRSAEVGPSSQATLLDCTAAPNTCPAPAGPADAVRAPATAGHAMFRAFALAF